MSMYLPTGSLATVDLLREDRRVAVGFAAGWGVVTFAMSSLILKCKGEYFF